MFNAETAERNLRNSLRVRCAKRCIFRTASRPWRTPLLVDAALLHDAESRLYDAIYHAAVALLG
jgi:hypothetical protein